MVILSRPELAIEFSLEPFSLLLVYLINNLSLPFDLYFGLHGLVAGYFLSKSLRVLSLQRFIRADLTVVGILLVLFFFASGISVVRQAAAASIIFYASLKCLIFFEPCRNKYFSYILLTCLAACFHYSAIALSIYFVSIHFFSRTVYGFIYALILSMFAIVGYYFLGTITQWIEFYFPVYASHLGDRALVHEVSIVFYFSFSAYLLLYASAWFFGLLPVFSQKSREVLIFLIFTLCLGVIFKLFSLQVLIFNRMVFYINPFVILFVGILFARCRPRVYLWSSTFVLVPLLFMLIVIKRFL